MTKINSDAITFLEMLGVEVPVCTLCGGLGDEQMPDGLCEQCVEQGYLIENKDTNDTGQSEGNSN